MTSLDSQRVLKGGKRDWERSRECSRLALSAAIVCARLREHRWQQRGRALRWIWPWQDRSRQFSWLKAIAFALVLWPGLRFLYQVATGDFGILAMALGGMVYWSGVWATVVLLLALAVTPALTILRWP